MRKIIFRTICLLLFFLSLHTNAQLIKGVIFDQKTQTTLPGATIYQDGTTNVTISDENGFFSLDTKGVNRPLIIRFIGYDSKTIDQPLQYEGKNLQILLIAELFSLEEVVIVKKGRFTRRQMMAAFRVQFLGTSPSAARCIIKNEADVILKYNVRNKTLIASARKPLQIINNNLQYEINFYLAELVVTYKSAESLNRNLVTSSYFSGSSFYTDYSENKKADKRRLAAYYGSTAHFMRALAYGNLKEEKWDIYVNDVPIEPVAYFKISDSLQFKKIELIKKPGSLNKTESSSSFNVKANTTLASAEDQSDEKPKHFVPLYNWNDQSLMEFLVSEIYVDVNGNYFPIYGIGFGGVLGDFRAGDLLPIDYYQTVIEMQNAQKTVSEKL
jgi:hypothetical protein